MNYTTVAAAAENKWSCLSADMHEPGVRLPGSHHMNQASDFPVQAAAENKWSCLSAAPYTAFQT